MLRDPLARVKSHEKLLNVLQQRETRNYKQKRLKLVRNNYLTWAMTVGSTKHGNRFSLMPQQKHLKIAKDTLSRFDFLLELSQNPECDVSILKLMGLGGHVMPHSNSVATWEETQAMTDEQYKEKDLLDIELYEYAKRLMELDCNFFSRLGDNSSDGMSET